MRKISIPKKWLARPLLFVLFLAILPPCRSGFSASVAMATPPGATANATAMPASETSATPVATFSEVTLEHNVRMRGHNGFMIHAHFVINDRVNVPCQLSVYFYDEKGNPVPAVGSSGPSPVPAIIWRKLNPKYPSTEYKDYQIFVPTTTFHALSKGSHDLYTRILILSENRQIGESGRNEFTLTL